MAYSAKSAAVAYGEVDWSSARTALMTPERTRRARIRLIRAKAWPVCIRFSRLSQGLSLWKNQCRWRLQFIKSTIRSILYPRDQRVADISAIVSLRIVE